MSNCLLLMLSDPSTFATRALTVRSFPLGLRVLCGCRLARRSLDIASSLAIQPFFMAVGLSLMLLREYLAL